MFYINIIILIVVSLSVSRFSYASPTSNEFEACNRLAVATLKYCLDDNDQACWKQSKANYDSCKKSVYEGHSLNVDRFIAEKERQKQSKLKQ